MGAKANILTDENLLEISDVSQYHRYIQMLRVKP